MINGRNISGYIKYSHEFILPPSVRLQVIFVFFILNKYLYILFHNLYFLFFQEEDLIGVKKYRGMMNITYQKVKSIDSSVIILARSLLCNGIDCLNQMYRYGMEYSMNGLFIHLFLCDANNTWR